LGGDLLVESREGQGTTFRVVLPPATVTVREASGTSAGPASVSVQPSLAPNSGPPSGATAQPRPRSRVLVIDDDAKLGFAIQQVLLADNDVDVVTDAIEALSMIEEGRRWDVILCDLLLPGVTGMDFYERLEKRAPELARRVVFMTGGACTNRARAFASRHAGRVLEKPVDATDLERVVNAHRRR
jgi:CheY-like chemotaxis protein